MDSLLDTQRFYYEGQDETPPPLIPHGIDPKTIHPKLKRRNVSLDHTTLIPTRPQVVPDEVKPITASDLPEGFPPELTYRSLAVYSLLRTLSVELRLAPFTPNVFLRALYLPFPNRLLGKIHVALLRILLSNLQLGYHWNDKTPPMDVVKKRLVDGLKWPLRAGDCFRFLDTYTWPIFYDDYCHLTADIIHASLHDKTDFAEQRNLDVSGIMSESDRRFTSLHLLNHNWKQPEENPTAGKTTKIETLYLNASESEDSSVEEEYDENEEKDDGDDDEDDDYVDKSDLGLRRLKSGSARKDMRGNYDINDTRNVDPNGQTPHGLIYNSPKLDQQWSAQQALNGNIGDTVLNSQLSSRFSPSKTEFKTHISRQFTTDRTGVVTIKVDPVSVKRRSVLQTFVPDVYGDTCLDDCEIFNCREETNFNVRKGKAVEFELFKRRKGKRSTHVPVGPLDSCTRNEPLGIRTNNIPLFTLRESTAGYTKAQPGVPVVAQDSSLISNLFVLNSYVRNEVPNNSITDTIFDHVVYTQKVDLYDQHSTGNVAYGAGNYWSQFDPIHEMRGGVPYHRLSLEHKLNILEFLVDEILDSFSELFANRHAKTRFILTPYGKLPSKDELENLENDDECHVSKQEGDLICCDGCTSSYLRRCLDLPDGDLPEGTWLCPDCLLVDPASFGPLRGGRKSSLDWFSIDDVEKAYHENESCFDLSKERSSIVKSSDRSVTTEFLVIHGFVFIRRKGSVTLYPPSSPLRSDSLKQLLLSTGSKNCSSWPLAQIPFETNLFSDGNGVSLNPKYFRVEEGRFNPNYYANKYRKAPLPPWVKFFDEAHSCEYEIRCGTASTNMLSSVLTSDVANDIAIVRSLRLSTALFDPYKMINSFLLRLEMDLTKASLLDWRWKSRETVGEQKSWAHEVKKCLSVKRLSKLLLQVVDAMHPRAFLESWYHATSMKVKVPEFMNFTEPKRNWPIDSLPIQESLRRQWERAPASAVSILAKREMKSFVEVVHDVRPDFGFVAPRSKKRKQQFSVYSGQRVVVKSWILSGKYDRQDAHPNTEVEDESEGESERFGQNVLSDLDIATAARKRVSRRSDRYFGEYGADELKSQRRMDNAAMSAKEILHEEKKHKISKLTDSFKSGVLPEGHWQLAGRRLFDPVGLIPKSDCRRLARNSGCIPAPFVTYVSSFEVGQVCFHHIWRKHVLRCNSFEELLLSIRVLEAFLDQGTIRKCMILAHRFRGSKSSNTTEILCTQRDLQNGLDHYLVGKAGQKGGQWLSAMTIDLAPLIQDKCRLRKGHVKAMSEKIRLKEVARIKEEIRIRDERRKVEEAKRKEENRKRDEAKKAEQRLKKEASRVKERETKVIEKEQKMKQSKLQKKKHLVPPSLSNQSNSIHVSTLPGSGVSNVVFETSPFYAGGTLSGSSMPVTQTTAFATTSQIMVGGNIRVSTQPSTMVSGYSHSQETEVRKPWLAIADDSQQGSQKKKRKRKTSKVPISRMEIQQEPANKSLRVEEQYVFHSSSTPAIDPLTQCPQVLARHITQAQSLLRKYGTYGVPQVELDILRKESESRLSEIFREGRAIFSIDKIREVVAFAESDALRLETNSQSGKSGKNESFKSMDALNSMIAGAPVLKQHMNNHSGNFEQPPNPSTGSETNVKPSMKKTKEKHVLSKGRLGGSKHHVTAVATPNVETALKSNARLNASANQMYVSVDQNNGIAALKNVSMHPVMSSEQVISAHQNEIRRLVQHYGIKFPDSELNRIRQKSEANLTEAMHMEGILVNNEQVTAVFRELEARVVNDGMRNGMDLPYPTAMQGKLNYPLQNETAVNQSPHANSTSRSDVWSRSDFSSDDPNEGFSHELPSTNVNIYSSPQHNAVENTKHSYSAQTEDTGEQIRNQHKAEIKRLIQKYGAGLPQDELQIIRRLNQAKLIAAMNLDRNSTRTSDGLLSILMNAESEVITEITEKSKTADADYLELSIASAHDGNSTSSSDRHHATSPTVQDSLFRYNAQDTNSHTHQQIHTDNNGQSLLNLYPNGVEVPDMSNTTTMEVMPHFDPISVTRLPHQLPLMQQDDSSSRNIQTWPNAHTPGWLVPDVRAGLINTPYGSFFSPLAENTIDQQRQTQNNYDGSSSTNQFTANIPTVAPQLYDLSAIELQMGGYGYQAPPVTNPIQPAPTNNYFSLLSQGFDQNLAGSVTSDILDLFQQNNIFDPDSRNQLNGYGGGFRHG